MRDCGSAGVISVRGGKTAASWLTPSGPMIAVFGGSLLPADEGAAGYDWVVAAAGAPSVRDPSLSECAVPLGAGSSASDAHRVPGTGQSEAS